MDPVYILIRTSNRPEFFGRMMETIKNQTYKNIVTIVHSDDPRDEYVTGDIIIKGPAYGPGYGNGTYNLYNNRLLRAIPPGEGWFHFIDDDDEYYDENAIKNVVAKSKRDHINVGRVVRWNGIIFPKRWRDQNSYQTECFFMHTDHKNKGKWHGSKGGDHYYSKQLTKVLPVNWIEDLTICKAQQGKGHGKKLDKGKNKIDFSKIFDREKKVTVIGMIKYRKGRKREWVEQGRMMKLKYGLAYEYEKQGIVKITHPGTYKDVTMPRQIYSF